MSETTQGPGPPRLGTVVISKAGLGLAFGGLKKIQVNIERQLSEVEKLLNGHDDPVTISAELMAVARSGLEMIAGEIQGHIADVSAALEPPRRRPQNITAARIASGDLVGYSYQAVPGFRTRRKVWDNDPENKYKHTPNGEIRYTLDGSPMLRPKLSPEMLEAMRVNAIKARAAKQGRGFVSKSAPIMPHTGRVIQHKQIGRPRKQVSK